ncbi:tyrosine-type recombinase/integrase [Haloferula sp.]|uniref:tyrosine-type recombinase/integrase n=1 Tax=Haloferula sp. TaxID=2497595 RepID=UPI003C71E8DE
MAKPLSYSVSRTPDGSYRVHLGGNKYVQRKTRLAIDSVIREHKMTRLRRGKELADAPPALVAELLALHARCEAAGTKVTDAVDFWLPYYSAQAASLPLADAIDSFVADCGVRKLASATINERVYRLRLWLRAQPDPEITVFEAAEVSVLRGFIADESERTTPASARNVWLVISAFGTWCLLHDLLTENPCKRISKPTPGERAVNTMSPKDAAELLRIAVTNYDREVLSYVTISLFAGLRPHEFVTEQPDGGWLYFDWKAIGRKHLVKEKRLGKVKRARPVPINSTLAAWIDYILEREDGTPSGPVVDGFAFYQRFRRWKRRLYPEHLPSIEDDLLRHSYGTYRVLKLDNVGKVALEMGNSESTIRQYYLNGERTADEAEQYWALTPDVVLKGKNTKKHR